VTASRGLSEVAVPPRARRWSDKTREYVESHKHEWGREHSEGVRMALRRFQRGIGRQGQSLPGVFERVGVGIPVSAEEVDAGHVVAIRDSPLWAPKTRSFLLQALRGFLRFNRCELAENRRLWAISGTALHRRWLTREQLVSVWEVCTTDLERVAVASSGFNGLRRIEVLRLRGADLNLVVDAPQARIWGKGVNGGKYRTIPVSRHLYAALLPLRTKPAERVFPYSSGYFDERLVRLGKLAGLPYNPSGHTLRRTFGRLAYYAGVPLVSIQNIYGHASPAMTAHYIGIDQAEMAAGLAQFERALEA
jgi:integrase